MPTVLLSINSHPNGDVSIEILSLDTGETMSFDDVADKADKLFICNVLEGTKRLSVHETINLVECQTFTF